jgi:hypothetical protein
MSNIVAVQNYYDSENYNQVSSVMEAETGHSMVPGSNPSLCVLLDSMLRQQILTTRRAHTTDGSLHKMRNRMSNEGYRRQRHELTHGSIPCNCSFHPSHEDRI